MIAGPVAFPVPGRTGGSGYLLPPPVLNNDELLLESGAALLLESGAALLLEEP